MEGHSDEDIKGYSGKDIIGRVAYGGPVCFVLSPIASEYTHFLYEFPTLMNDFNKKQRAKIFKIAYARIQNYFKKEIKQGVKRRLSVEELMKVLEDMKPAIIDNPKECLIHPVLPRSLFFDPSGIFFMKLYRELSKGI